MPIAIVVYSSAPLSQEPWRVRSVPKLAACLIPPRRENAICCFTHSAEPAKQSRCLALVGPPRWLSRQGVFDDKGGCRTKEPAAKQLDQSLQRLRTGHIDLLEFHEVIRMEDPDRIVAPGGASEAFLEARKS